MQEPLDLALSFRPMIFIAYEHTYYEVNLLHCLYGATKPGPATSHTILPAMHYTAGCMLCTYFISWASCDDMIRAVLLHRWLDLK